MIDINRNNYEAYLLDLAEGELSPANEKLLRLFLDENPDLEVDYDLFELEKIPAEKIKYENKSDLKKTGILTDFSKDNFDELCIARIEGDLSIKEIVHFDEIIESNKEKEREYNLYKLAKLIPDQNLVFKNKKRLQKRETKIFTLSKNYKLISAAASIIFLIGLYLFIPKEEENIILVSDVEQNTIKEKRPDLVQEKEDLNITPSEVIAESQTKENKVIPAIIKEVEEKEKVAKKDPVVRLEYDRIAFINPISIEYNFRRDVIFGNLKNVKLEELQDENLIADNSMSFKSYLVSSFNKRVLKKDNKNKVEFFDIAQAGVEGINKITGTKMSLERVYTVSGEKDRTEFNSRLLAFSTPMKKD